MPPRRIAQGDHGRRIPHRSSGRPRGRAHRGHHLCLPGQAWATRCAAQGHRWARRSRRCCPWPSGSWSSTPSAGWTTDCRPRSKGIAAVAAVVIMTRMLFWMRAQGRAIKGQLEIQVSSALAQGQHGGAHRPGVHRGHPRGPRDDAVLPGHHRVQSGDATSAVIGGVLGLVVAISLGWAIFAAGIRINLGALLHGHGHPAHLRRGRARGVCHHRVHGGGLPARRRRRCST